VLPLSAPSNSHYLKVIHLLLTIFFPRLAVTSIFTSIFLFNACVRKQFLHKVTNAVSLPSFIVSRMFLSSLNPCNISSFFTHDFLNAIENAPFDFCIYVEEFISQIIRLPSPI